MDYPITIFVYSTVTFISMTVALNIYWFIHYFLFSTACLKIEAYLEDEKSNHVLRTHQRAKSFKYIINIFSWYISHVLETPNYDILVGFYIYFLLFSFYPFFFWKRPNSFISIYLFVFGLVLSCKFSISNWFWSG